ncbi:MAG: hypothetical protein AMXMBFR76_19900 [Pseudomonadota bacterium]|jgi:Co/Zn/Cd efflux system component
MSEDCCATAPCSSGAVDPRYRKALWAALAVNALMFGVELGGAFAAGSVSLLADAADFLGDAGNYGLSLAVLSMGLIWRARAALLKGLTMGVFGLFVLGKAAFGAAGGVPPEPLTMGVIAVLALTANVGVALTLYAFRSGDANMRSVWLCSRNDAIGNVAVMLAALGVFGTGQAWPDLLVAAVMGVLGISAAWAIVRQARSELRAAPAAERRLQRDMLH